MEKKNLSNTQFLVFQLTLYILLAILQEYKGNFPTPLVEFLLFCNNIFRQV